MSKPLAVSFAEAFYETSAHSDPHVGLGDDFRIRSGLRIIDSVYKGVVV